MSLYLKYRPRDFDNLVGQAFIKDTLKTAIKQDKLVGAYLFCGPRGTGKTSTARLLAKTINCLQPKEGNPCLECDICTQFQEERLVDIIEIDAASHTGVDNIREIIERAQFAPTKTKYKVYIIDEVHMLSKGAFNALLKILEEPPKHVKFILATTETHKVPETIISRCQRYDFKSISDTDIKERLQFIAKKEEITIDEPSLQYITKHSGGALRNAINLFEQLIIDNEISYTNIEANLGLLQEDFLASIYKKLQTKDASVIEDIESSIKNGANLKLFLKDLIWYIKDSILGEVKNGKATKENISLLETLHETAGKMKTYHDEEMTLIIGILKIISEEGRGEVIPTVPTSHTQPKPKPEITIKKEPKEIATLSSGDIQDIFEIETSAATPISENTSTGTFDTDTWITALKKLGAKAGLTMSLRSASISTDEVHVIIQCKTGFAKTSIDTEENRLLLTSSLESIGLSHLSIKIQ